MALNVKNLADRLKKFEDGAKASEFARLKWKPKEGTQCVRIVPYVFDPENSIIELKFYYKIGDNAPILAPCTFDKPDPILEALEALRGSSSLQHREIAKKFAPASRFFTPIIVRGEEEQGVKFWEFGVQVWKQIVKYATSPKWGDITSLTEGNDLDVEFHKISNKKNAQGEAFPETIITPSPQKTPAVDPTRRDLMEKVKNQTDILVIHPLKTYEELEIIWQKYINPKADASPTAAPVASSPTPTPAAVDTKSPEALTDEFKKFFEKK